MKQKLRVFLTLLLCAVASVGWGEEVTAVFEPSNFDGQGISGSGGVITATVNDVTFACDKGYGTTQIRCYSGGNVTISSSYTITAISFTFSGSYNGGLETSYTGLSTTSWEKELSSQARITKVEVTYDKSGTVTPTVATPTFNPAAGAVEAGTKVTISSDTDGATIYYTTDGNDPTTNSTQGTSVIINETCTVKAIAVKADYNNSAVATATYSILQVVSGYTVDFESDLSSYVDWTFTNAEKSTGAIPAHGGTYYATTGGKTTAAFQTKEKVAYPNVFTCYVSKTTTNTTASTWEIQVSSDGSSWTKVAEKSATDMTKGEWNEFTADIKAAGYTDVYVRLYYSGSTAVRTVDDISLTTYTPAAVEEPIIMVAEEFTFSTTATITCVTEGATIYYSFDNVNWTEYTDALTLTATTTIYAKAVKGEDESSVAQATATKVLVTPEVAISATNLNVGENATVTTDGPVVTLSTSNEAVASVDGTTVTAVALGTATITASWEANSDYAAGSKVFEITVTDPDAPGQQNNPYTVAQAREAIDAGTGVTGVYATGTVSEIVTPYSSQYSNITFDIVDEEGSDVTLRAYRCAGDEAANVQVGDVVVIYGNLTKYENSNNGTIIYEFEAGNQLISLTRPEKPKHQVSFYVNGEVSSTIEVSEEEAISFPENPADIEGKTFVGWTGNEIEGTQDEAPEMVTSATMGTEDVAFYAVFANEISGEVTEITDVLTRATTGVTGTSYSSWSGKTLDSSAVYAGNSAGGNSSIQLRSTDNSGIITTKSGGKLKKIVVDWNDNTTDGRQLWILGKNTKYSSAKELYSIDTRGEDVGIVDKGTTELSVAGDYEYLGIRSKNGALYLNSISITWEGETAATYSEYCTTVSPENITVTISDKATGADGAYYSSVYYRNKALQVPEGVECQTYKMIDGALTISKTYAAGDVVPKGEAVVIKTSAFGNVVFSVSTTSEAKDAYSQLLGVDEATTITETGYKYYKLTLNSAGDDRTAGFYWDKNSNEGTKINAAAHKCYLRVPAAEVEAKSAFVFGEETAGIGQIEIDQTSNAAIYNLSGQRVNKAQKGIYIVNGKKVVIK